jgi:hypothetical protein
MFGDQPAMQLLAQIRQNPLRIIGLLLIAALIIGICIYARRPIGPKEHLSFDEYVIYAAVSSPDHIVFYKTFEGIELDQELASQAGLSLTDKNGSGIQVSRVTFIDDRTKASVQVGYFACGPDYNYIVGYNLLKDSVAWHKDGYSRLIQEVFC